MATAVWENKVGILAIIGGQYGSEGKGVIASKFAPICDAAIRVGGSNAGHSIIHEGRIWKMRMVPVAWTNPDTTLILGPAAVIDEPVLRDEITKLEDAGYRIAERLLIDRRATVQLVSDSVSEREYVDRIGSTAKGIGAARIRRLQRDPKVWYSAAEAFPDLQVVDTTRYYRPLAEVEGPVVMIEGTQGYGLSITHGPWPYATSTDLTMAQLLNDCALAPSVPLWQIMVFRTFPIRVAGNSGPMLRERTWGDMGREPETTTVTGKIRRVGEFDWDLARDAVRVNRPTMIALTFADYLDASIEGCDAWNAVMASAPVREFVKKMESNLDVPVTIIGTGGPDWSTALRPSDPFSLGGGSRQR